MIARAMMQLLAVILAVSSAATPLSTDPNLSIVTAAILSRHSIKVPGDVSSAPLTGCLSFPNQGVWDPPTPGVLTRKGLLVAEAQGRFLKQRYASLLGNCAQNAVHTLADTEERDEWTAQGLLNGLYDGCGTIPTYVSQPADALHLLFSEGQDGNMFPGCSRATEAQVQGMVGNDIENYFHNNFRPELLNISRHANCPGLLTLPTYWAGGYWTTYKGGFQVASSYANYWLTQALNGLPITSSAGPMSLEEALDMYKVTMGLFDLYRNPFNLQSFGAEPIASILAALDQVVNDTASTLNDPLLPTLEAKLSLYVGHDVQLEFVRHLLGFTWSSPGWLYFQPIFAGALSFELFQHNTTGEHLVRLGFLGNSPRGMLDSERTNSSAGVSWVPISVPGCSSSSTDPYMCSYSTFKQLISERLPTKCMSPAMRSFMGGVAASYSRTIESSHSDVSTVSIVLIVVGSLLITASLVVAVVLWRRSKETTVEAVPYVRVRRHAS